MNNKNHIIVVAGGSGKRMNSDIPKQYLLLNNMPIIANTFNRLHNVDESAIFTVVIAEKDKNLWDSCEKFIPFHKKINVAFGGPERFHSVKSALSFVQPNEVVAIHDSVRPLFSSKMIVEGLQAALMYGSVVPVVEMKESVRKINGAISKSVDRNSLRLCQTPQFFKADILLDAYRQTYCPSFTDDASVVEAAGYSIRMINGNSENIKITTQNDLIFAEAIINKII